MVTRGPGATNAAAGVHVAFQDSTPLVLVVGQVGRGMLDREAFQEMDYRRMYGEMAKWVAQVDQTERIPEYVSRAFHTAASGRPGPVVLALPEDVLSARADVPDARPAVPGVPKAAASDVEAFGKLLAESERPMLIVGGGGWSADAARDLARFSAAHHVPVSASFRCQDYIDNRHPNYCGHAGIGINPRTAKRFRECDLLVALGTRLGEITTSGYSLVDIPNPASRFVHVHPGAEELGRVYRPDLAVNAAAASFTARDRGSGTRRRRFAPHLDQGVRGRIPGVDGTPLHPRAGAAGARGGPHPRAPRRGRHRVQWGRQLRGMGEPLLRVPRLPYPARPDLGIDGAMGCRPRSPRRLFTRTGRWCASRVTGASS